MFATFLFHELICNWLEVNDLQAVVFNADERKPVQTLLSHCAAKITLY